MIEAFECNSRYAGSSGSVDYSERGEVADDVVLDRNLLSSRSNYRRIAVM